MKKFLILNRELRELIGDEKAMSIGEEIKQYQIDVTTVYGEVEKVIFQPEGQSLVLFLIDGADYLVDCESCHVPLENDDANRFLESFNESEVDYIFPLNGIEHFPYYRLDYFLRKGKSIEAQVERHNELIKAGMVDAVVSVYNHDSNRKSLIEIYAGERFTEKY